MSELKQIQLYDFRRFKASKPYHLTRDTPICQRNIRTQRQHPKKHTNYISLFDERNITWIQVAAKTEEEIKNA